MRYKMSSYLYPECKCVSRTSRSECRTDKGQSTTFIVTCAKQLCQSECISKITNFKKRRENSLNLHLIQIVSSLYVWGID